MVAAAGDFLCFKVGLCFRLIPATCRKKLGAFFLLISRIYLQPFSWLLFTQNNCLPGEIGGDHLISLQATIRTSRPRTLCSELQGEQLHRLCRKGKQTKELASFCFRPAEEFSRGSCVRPEPVFYGSLRTHRSTSRCRFKSLRRGWFFKKKKKHPGL